jgi:hypothetical protein
MGKLAQRFWNQWGSNVQDVSRHFSSRFGPDKNMPPKGSNKHHSLRGNIERRGEDVWRASFPIAPGRVEKGPDRSCEADVVADLAAIRAVQSLDDVPNFVASLKTAARLVKLKQLEQAEELAAGLGADIAPPVPPDAEQMELDAERLADPTCAADGTGDVAAPVSPNSATKRRRLATPPSKPSVLKTKSSGVSQPTAAKRDDQKVLLLQLRRPHYDAIKSGSKTWEARPLLDGSLCGRQSIFDKLAQVGRVVVLQSGANTNDRVRIAEVRRYTRQGHSYPLPGMVAELGADLLPDVADERARAKVYESLYGIERCARGFVAMRLEWPSEAAA